MTRERENISLQELLQEVQGCLDESFGSPRWVRAEISGLKVNRSSGHCYFDLVQKSAAGAVLASARATVWASRYRLLSAMFRSETGSGLSDGMEILARVQVAFSPQFGLSLNIIDIDPSFTIGAAERLRQRTVERLKAEGMFDMNSTLPRSAVPFRIAVVTSEQAAGWRDFVRHISDCPEGYVCEAHLFPAVMQGAECPQSIIAAMDAALESPLEYDALLILRGGGSALDLSCYDDYDLAASIAQYPVPVFTGVGHDHDYHVCDMVCNANLRTPTALADFILDCFRAEDARLTDIGCRISDVCSARIRQGNELLENIWTRAVLAYRSRIRREEDRIGHLASLLDARDPFRLLKNGYALADGPQGRIMSAGQVAQGDRITLMFFDGSLEVTVNRIENKDTSEYGQNHV